MRHLVRLGALAAPCVVLVALLLPASAPRDTEGDRLRAHFATVERELLTRNVAQLSPAQHAARARHIERLRAYAAAGVFPRNTDFRGQRVPYFIDRAGTRCAMAHLIEESGGGSYVQRVVATMNNGTIAEIAGDAELRGPIIAWLTANGLSLAEAARIQPAYCGDDCCGEFGYPPCESPAEPVATKVSTGYKLGTGVAVLGGLSAIAMHTSLLRSGVSRRASGWLGVATGALGLGLGLARINDDGDFGTLARLNVVAGAAALGSGVYALLTPGRLSRERRVRPAPWVRPDGTAGVQVRIGL